MRVLHATGSPYMELLLQTVPGIQLLPEVFFREDLYSAVEEAHRTNPHNLCLVVAQALKGQQDFLAALQPLRDFPGLRVIFLAGRSTSGLIQHLHTLGYYDIIYGDVDNETLSDYLHNPRGPEEAARELERYGRAVAKVPETAPGLTAPELPPSYHRVVKQQLVAVWSGKPGVGKTFLAVNLAVALAREKVRVALVDCDVHNLGISAHLNLYEGEKSLEKALKSQNPEEIRNNLVHHPQWPHLAILSGSEYCRPEAYQNIGKEGVLALLSTLREDFEIIIMDTASDPQVLTTFLALRQANLVFLVTNQDYTQSFITKRYLELFKRLHLNPDKFRVVLNSYLPTANLNPNMIEEMLGLPLAYTVPFHYREVLESIFESSPVVTGQSPQLQDLRSAIINLANELYPLENRQGSPTILKRLFQPGRLVKWGG